MIVSGGDEIELNKVFEYKEIKDFFEKGIFGSPESKTEILKREILNKNIKMPALYFGDSKKDYIASLENGLDFVFIKKWTEFKDYKMFCKKNSILVLNSIGDIAKIES